MKATNLPIPLADGCRGRSAGLDRYLLGIVQMAAGDTLQPDTESEFTGESDADPGSASEVLLYRPARRSPPALPDSESPPAS